MSTMTEEREEHAEGDAATVALSAAKPAAVRKPPWGLFVAPVGILALAGVVFWYYQSLSLGSGESFQQASALDWDGKLRPQLLRHLYIAFWSTVLVVAIAVPLGILLTRPRMRRVAPWVLTVANSGQALPAYGLLVLFATILSFNTTTVVVALVFYALLPVLRNTMVGLDAVDRSLLEAGRGMGMTKWRVLTRIELPLSLTVILAGVRVAMVINIGMATLAYLIGGGGLGITIASGLKNQQDPVLIVGSALVAIVALTFDWVGAIAERFLRPRGV